MTEEVQHEFRKGMQHIKNAANRSASFDGPSATYFKWQDGETKLLRFLTEGDELITVAVHEFVPCVDNTRRQFVCRKEFDPEGPCELCDNPEIRRRDQGYGIAVERIEHRDESGRVDGFQDKVDYREVTEGGTTKTKPVPLVGIVRQGPKNFWSYFDAVMERNGTISDRDFEVKRRGSGTDTDYVVFPLDAVEIKNLDTRYANYVPDISGMLVRMGSAEYYAKHLHGLESGDSNGNGNVDRPTTIPEGDTEFERQLKEQKEQLANSVQSYE